MKMAPLSKDHLRTLVMTLTMRNYWDEKIRFQIRDFLSKEDPLRDLSKGFPHKDLISDFLTVKTRSSRYKIFSLIKKIERRPKEEPFRGSINSQKIHSNVSTENPPLKGLLTIDFLL